MSPPKAVQSRLTVSYSAFWVPRRDGRFQIKMRRIVQRGGSGRVMDTTGGQTRACDTPDEAKDRARAIIEEGAGLDSTDRARYLDAVDRLGAPPTGAR